MDFQKQIKKQLIEEASSNPQSYFPVRMLEHFGFERQKCKKCSVYFWTSVKREICGDITCVGKYSFIRRSLCKKKFEFAEVYEEFRKFMEKRGYLHIESYPIVARFRDDLDFTIASIIGFQPFVTKGTVEPQSNQLIVPQNCLRFSDIDNVGYTGRHGTNFVMIGQLAFESPENYNQDKYFKDLFEWFVHIMGIEKKEIQIHEDAWVGGGDCGASLEFFSCGLELGNQVYMSYDMQGASSIDDLKELPLKVLDMGMGLERCCWFSKGSFNQYEASMPYICKYLFEKANFTPNWELYSHFLPYSGTLNLDEVEDIDLAWKDIAKKIGVGVDKLKEGVEPIVGIYSIADHTRTLLYALSDGALPSNVKGGYNLRLVLRRCLDFIYKFKWDINLYDVIVLQAEECSKLYSNLKDELFNINEIIDLEVEKYRTHKEKVHLKVQKLAQKQRQFSLNDFINLYVSEGISPDELKSGFKYGGIDLKIPQNFFTKVSNYFEKQNRPKLLSSPSGFSPFVKGISPTELLFYEDSCKEEAEVEIVKEFSLGSREYIILDKTLFYPTMGGQSCDFGMIGDREVIDVLKVGNVVIHEVK